MRERLMRSRLALILLGLWSGGFIDVSSHHTSGVASGMAYVVALVIIGVAVLLAGWQEGRC